MGEEGWVQRFKKDSVPMQIKANSPTYRISFRFFVLFIYSFQRSFFSETIITERTVLRKQEPPQEEDWGGFWDDAAEFDFRGLA